MTVAPRFSLSQGDAVAWLQSLDDESIDLFVTDPAYESLEKHRAIGTTTRLKNSAGSSNQWFEIFKNERFPGLFAEIYRVLKRDAHLYMFCDAETMFVVKPMGEAAGFKFWKPLVFDKVTIGMGYHWRARCEFILFFEKGKRRLNDLGAADVLTCKRVRDGYPTEKPVEINEALIRNSSSPNEIVADTFMGSGSAGVAAVKLGRHFAGNDISPDSISLARRRLVEHEATEGQTTHARRQRSLL